MKMFALHCGGENLNRAVIDAFDPNPAERIHFPYFSYLVQHPQGNVLFDTGCHPDFIEDPTTRLGPAAAAYEILMSPGDDIVSCLATVGVTPEQVPHVVQSHLHYDHAGGLEFFPDATIYVGKQERDFASSPPVYQREYVLADFDLPLKWQEVEGEHDIFGDGTVVLFPTPGHTPGHQSMLVRLPGKTYILVGDAAYDRGKMAARRLAAVLWSPDAVISSWELLEAKAAEHGAGLIFTHDIDFRETIRIAPDAWYE